jgi:hypothetical protein
LGVATEVEVEEIVKGDLETGDLANLFLFATPLPPSPSPPPLPPPPRPNILALILLLLLLSVSGGVSIIVCFFLREEWRFVLGGVLIMRGEGVWIKDDRGRLRGVGTNPILSRTTLFFWGEQVKINT